ncbi:capsular biosynthesis protein [Yoonia sp. R2331]|uniref:capsular polysaccharide export protein, LipB/KpsS family n=1 Tax=Yoonia sp. R2331 TaxID=3237238 RepID=UPI0034E586B4
MTRIAWLPEPPKHIEKARFFAAIAQAAGGGRALSPFAVSWCGFPETNARAADCLARAKRQPKGALGRVVKLAFLKGRYNYARRWFLKHPDHAALCWQGLTGARRAVMLGAQDASVPRLFAELSPLPGYLTLDPKGVNAEGSVPQDPAFYDNVDPDAALIARIKSQFQARAARRADVGQTSADLPDAPYIFVPLQVPDDSQMILFAGWVGSASGFVAVLAAASQALPDGWHLRIKEHPSAKQPLTAEINAAIAAGARIALDNQTDSFAQLASSRAVLTVNSSMGLQAMFWDKPVITTGQAFYALPGLTHDASSDDALQSLLERVAGLPCDKGLRQRFLTWLATCYYIPQDGQGYDQARIAARLKGDI